MLKMSDANYWVQCPAYSAGTQQRERSAAAIEGTAAAWLADMVLKHDATHTDDLCGRLAQNGHEITPDMCSYIQGYVDWILERASGEPILSEHEGSLLSGQIVGRTDTALNVGRTLEIVDLKYGYKIVEPEDNYPLILYAAMLLADHHDTVKLTIYQPRPMHPNGIVRTAEYTRDKFYEKFVHVSKRAKIALSPDTLAEPGTACHRCSKRTTCDALAKNLYSAYDYITSSEMINSLDPKQLSCEYDFITKLKRLVDDKHTALESELEARLDNDEFIADYYRKPTHSNYYFKYDPDTVGMLLGVDPYKKVAKSPAELEREGYDVSDLKTRRINKMKITKFDPSHVRKLFNE